MKTLYILDAAGYIYRSYFAIRNMTNSKGESTNALFGFVRSVLKFLKDFKPEHTIAIFDGKDNARGRTAIYPAYKAHRQTMPPDLLHQIQWAKEFCGLIGLSVLDHEGVEADDTIGSIALYAAEKNTQVFICSTDKDLCQLVSPHISMIDTYKDNQIIGIEEVQQKFGVPPGLIVDYLALLGDASDNIPGVPGIGPKTAADLLNQWGSLEGLFLNVEAVSGKKRELLKENKESALISRQLALLKTDVDFPHDDRFFIIKPVQIEPLMEFYNERQFHTLMKELSSQEPQKNEPSNTLYELVDEEQKLKELLNDLSVAKEICIATLGTGSDPMSAELVGIGLGVEEKKAWYIPLNGHVGNDKVLAALKPILASPEIGFYGHNLKYDYHLLRNAGIPIQKIAFDTLIASYLLNTHTRRHSLEELSLENFGFAMTETAALTGKGKSQVAMKEVPIEKASAYCCEYVDFTIRLKNLFVPQIESRQFQQLYYGLELPLTLVLAEMEQAGIFLDVKNLEELKQYLEKEIAALSLQIFECAGETFNLNSPQQLGKVLFENLKLPSPKKGSTAADVLEALKWNYPIAGKIQEYRVLEKLRSTYVDTLPLQVNAKTGRIHCTFNQSVAATGRLSCQNPNLQNIPIRSAVGLKIREAFRPAKPGWSYVSADYSQIELRLLAHLSEDPVLIEAFNAGEDIHTHTASRVFGVPLEQVTKEMRSKAKAVNFGVIYGQGSFGLSQAIGIPQKEAASFIQHYFEHYPKVKQFLESCKDAARIAGKSVTLTGRERIIPEILSKNIQIRNAAERLAVNTPFQGSAADLIKMAMLNIANALKKSSKQGFMILQIHDELMFEVPDDEIEYFKHLIKDKMENVISLKVPLTVDVEVGKNWEAC